MTAGGSPMLVLGIGNVLLGDDGVGVRVVTELARLVEAGLVTLPTDARLVDGGTLGRDLLPLVADASALVVVDAAELQAPPGRVRVLRNEEIGRGRGPGAIDGGGLLELLIAASIAGTLPDDVALVGIQPGIVAAGSELSTPVRSGVPQAIEHVLGELRRFAAITPGRGIGMSDEAEAAACG